MKVQEAQGLGLLAVLLAAPAAAQHHDAKGATGNAAHYRARAREATSQYQDRAAAIADGFRPLGPDAPAMGRHWLHPGRVLDGGFDPARPAGLTYINVAGRPTLIGVFYVLPLEPGARPPVEPAAAEAWHFHNGDFTEEAVLSVHAPADGEDAPGLRIAVLHAWVWDENPDGLFAAENWSLPYVRLGLRPPDGASHSAAKGAALATEEGRAFYGSRVSLAGGPPVEKLEPVLRAHGERIRARIQDPGASSLGRAEVRWLEDSWDAAVRDVVAAAAPATREQVRRVLDGRLRPP